VGFKLKTMKDLEVNSFVGRDKMVRLQEKVDEFQVFEAADLWLEGVLDREDHDTLDELLERASNNIRRVVIKFEEAQIKAVDSNNKKKRIK
jgi:exonuclease I